MGKTVTLPIGEYNELEKLDKEVKNGKKCVVRYDMWSSIYYYTDSEIVEKLTNEINNLLQTNKEYKKDSKELEKLKTMSSFQFRKWKKNLGKEIEESLWDDFMNRY